MVRLQHCPPPSAPVLSPNRFRPRAAPSKQSDDAEILQDNLTAGAGLAAGFAKWSPDSGETIGERLGAIVGGAMGYEPEDLPWEVPLIELGLDSLMAVRIKNRVEYDFDLPPIQLTAVRDANLYAVEKLIEYAIEHRDEVDQLAESQKGQTAEEIAAAQARADGRRDDGRRTRGKAGRGRQASSRVPAMRRCRGTPAGPAGRSRRRGSDAPPFRRRRPIPAARPRPDRRSRRWPLRPRC